MMAWQKVCSLLVLVSLWMGDMWVSADMKVVYIPSQRHMISGKTIYALMTASKTWNEAAATCKAQFKNKGGSLVVIDSQIVMEVVNDLIGGSDVWIGLHWWTDSIGNIKQAWDDFTCSYLEDGDFTNYVDASGANYNLYSRCYYIQQGTWRHQNCNHPRRFVCQYQETATDELTACGLAEPFATVNANLYKVPISPLTDQDCQAECTSTLGCIFTSVYRQEGCMMGVVEPNNTMFFRNRCVGKRTVNTVMAMTADSSQSPKVCQPNAVSYVTVSDKIITGDAGGNGNALGGISTTVIMATSTAAPPPAAMASTTTETVTVTLSASTEVLTTTQLVMTSVYVDVSCTDPPIVMTPLIETTTETITQTQVVTTTETASAAGGGGGGAAGSPCPTSSTSYSPCQTSTITIDGTVSVTTSTEYVQVVLTPSSCPPAATPSPCPTLDLDLDPTATVNAAGAGGGGGGASASNDVIICDSLYNNISPTSTIFETVCPTASLQLTVNSAATSVDSTNDTMCNAAKNITLNPSQLQVITKSIINELIVPKDTLSQTRRKKESAPDKRTTAQTSGYMAIFCLSFTFGGVLLADFPVFFTQIKDLVGKTRS